MSLKYGDAVIFNDRYGLDKKYQGIYRVVSDPWKIGEKEVVKLLTFRGAFCVDGLEKVE